MEALRAGRKVIGADVVPMAVAITRMEVTPCDLTRFEGAFARIRELASGKIMGMYPTTCPECREREAFAEWYEWTRVVACPLCGKPVRLVDAGKTKGTNKYQCPECRRAFLGQDAETRREEMVRLKYRCTRRQCRSVGEKPPDTDDLDCAAQWARDFDRVCEDEGLWFPPDEFPDGDRMRDDGLASKGISHFEDLFTRRNLIGVSRLYQAIQKLPEVMPDLTPYERELWFLVFTSAVERCTRTAYVLSDHRLKNHGHTYWMPDASGEINVWRYFETRRVTAVDRGLRYIEAEVAAYSREGSTLADLTSGKSTFLLREGSSDSLPFPPGSVDAIVTDPPFGGNVQYGELADLWQVWRRTGVMDKSKEAIQTRNDDFPGAKSLQDYEESLYSVFRQCHRVLKPRGWMVLTFHNREIPVWMALHRAVRRAGFRLPDAKVSRTHGIVYQPPIEEYTSTPHQTSPGAMLGDFVLSFQRQDDVPSSTDPLSSLSTEEENGIVTQIANFLRYQGGADDNAVITCLVPYLSDRGILHRVADLDFSSLLQRHFHFDRQTRRWYTRDMLADGGTGTTPTLRPLDHIPAEIVTEELVTGYLKQHDQATIDDLLGLIYTMLVNSYRPGIKAVNNVLSRLCTERTVKTRGRVRRVFSLKPDGEREPVTPPDVLRQPALFGEDRIATNLSHNEIIKLLCNYAARASLGVHVGRTEQNKVPAFAKVSVRMGRPHEFGIADQRAFKRIMEIDVLYLKGNNIAAAFEVATTIGTAKEAINDRYRDLFASTPNLNIPAVVIVKDRDLSAASDILYSLANRQDGLAQRVTLLRLSDMVLPKILSIARLTNLE